MSTILKRLSRRDEDTDVDVSTSLRGEGYVHRNVLAKFRHQFRKPLAECFGTMLYVTIGLACNLQAGLSTSNAVVPRPIGDELSLAIGWAGGAALGVYAAIHISGGHINPALTLAFVIFRRQPWHEFFIYFASQTTGAFLAALIVYGVYAQAISVFEAAAGGRSLPGTAAFFVPYPPDWSNSATRFFSEFVETALLLILVFVAADKYHKAPTQFIPIFIFVVVIGYTVGFGMEGGGMNPARIIGPRLVTAIIYGREALSYENARWLATSVVAQFLGSITGGALYDFFIYDGEESPLNYVKQKESNSQSGRQRGDSEATDPEKGFDV
ncbi:hypothetical protein FRB99_000703 [Tulasnella sp. 403]|nr:hypothetical protein FRB99_000703 [Tulasnella sp. 403]